MALSPREPHALLAALIDEPESTLIKALEAVEKEEAYERFSLPKKSGGARTILAPKAELKRVQRGINVLLEPLPLSMAVHGFRRARSIVTGAKAHLQARALINIDLKDFFHSVDGSRVRAVLARSLLPRLTEETQDLSAEEGRAVIELIAKLTTVKLSPSTSAVLPQGAPTSPFLANLSARGLDDAIRKLLSETPGSFTYTRYADDLTISAPHELHRSLLGELLRTVQRAGFRHHPHKVRIASTLKGSPHYRQRLEINHLLIDPQTRTVRIPKARMERFRMFVRQASLSAPLQEEDLRRVEGIVSFVFMVYGELPNSLKKAYAAFCQAHKKPALQRGKSKKRARALHKELYP